MFTRLKFVSFHVAGLITLLNWFTESLTSLADSGFKTEKDHLNIKIFTALLFIMLAHYSVIWKYVS